MHTKITTAIGTLAVSVSAALATESSVPHLKADLVHMQGFSHQREMAGNPRGSSASKGTVSQEAFL